jgi:1,4-dihydroxy-2-naphthoyl-CoA hydrolase
VFCHAAYEESLAAAGINLRSFFSGQLIAIPITQATVDFLHPLFCGDSFSVNLTPHLIEPDTFRINYKVFLTHPSSQKIAKAQTLHVCINPQNRRRKPLPDSILQWIDLWQPLASTSDESSRG